jgi:hypothetical protein
MPDTHRNPSKTAPDEEDQWPSMPEWVVIIGCFLGLSYFAWRLFLS